MKLTTLAYSLLIFISCGGNTAKEKPVPEVFENPTEQAKVIAKNTEPNTVVTDNAEELKEETILEETKEREALTDMRTKVEENLVVVAEIMEKKEAASESLEETETKENREEETAMATGTEATAAEVGEELTEAPSEEIAKEIPAAKTPSHDAWNQLLKKYVDKAGNVDYKSFKNSGGELSAYLDALAKKSPTADWSKNEKLAYYINLYNAATVKLILDNYPTKSIKDLSRPWGKDIVKIGDKLYSLGHIEHKILRKMNEPRIHFAINCASYSCPKLVNKAFTASAMESQLEAATKDFVNDTTRNRFSAKEAKLSEIFKWYKGDFTHAGSIKEYINRYLATPMTSATKIRYLDYNWDLNEK